MDYIGFVFLFGALGVGYFAGTYFENRHYKSLEEREEKLHHIPVITGEWKSHLEADDEGVAISAGTVVASDYFKTFISGLRQIFGGRMSSYESLIDRGRRESILRVKEKAARWGAYKIINVRIETSNINSSSGNNGAPIVELFAYGTALRKKENGQDGV